MELGKLETIKQQIVRLSPPEKSELARFFQEQQHQDQLWSVTVKPEVPDAPDAPDAPNAIDAAADHKRQQQMAWMIAHREAYAGQYVALDGDRLVGQGRTLAEAHRQARQQGVSVPFLVRLTSEHEVLFGGW